MNNLSTWELIHKSLQEKIPVMLLYVLQSIGSSPGRQGFFMAINAACEMEGTIGGGIMEHKFAMLAKEKLAEPAMLNDEPGIRIQVHDKTAKSNQSGMICSGEQTILLHRLMDNEITVISSIINSLRNGKNGELQLSPKGIAFEEKAPSINHEYTFNNTSDWVYREKTGYKNKLSIIGGGHCALALSTLMYSMDFYIRLYEEREEIDTLTKNKYVHEVIHVADYSELADMIDPGQDQYVVIMTVGYRTDDIAVRALMDKSFAYLGVLGSTTKIARLMDDYKKSGIPDDWLQRIHAPVGLPIKSQTAAEIAVSIAAEIIAIKNKSL